MAIEPTVIPKDGFKTAAVHGGSLVGKTLHPDCNYLRAQKTINAFRAIYFEQTGLEPPYPHQADFECTADYHSGDGETRLVDIVDKHNGKTVIGIPASYLQVQTADSQKMHLPNDDPRNYPGYRGSAKLTADA